MKRLLLIVVSLLTFSFTFAAEKKKKIEDFDKIEIGTTFKMYNSNGVELDPSVASATVIKDPNYEYGNVLHVKIGNVKSYVEIEMPDNLTASQASSKYEKLKLLIFRPEGQPDRFQGEFSLWFGSAQSTTTAFANINAPVGKEANLTYNINKVSGYGKTIRFGFSVKNVEFYLDDIYFLYTDYGYDYTDPLQTARYHADLIGKNLGVCVSPNQLSETSREGQTIYRNFNMVVGENAMKFDATEPRRGQFNYSGGDQIVNFALKHDMEVRGHTLAWHSQTSQWVHDGNYSKKEMLAILKNHIFNVVGHWKGKITEWDVVNEVMAENVGRGVGQGYQLRGKGSGQESVWYDRCGEEFIDSAFVWAHQADPDAILYINDYNIGHWDNHYESGKTHAIYNLAKRLKEDGIPIHGVGMQMHTSVEGLNVASIERTVREFEKIGLKCIITELDMAGSNPSGTMEQATQATKYAGLADIICRYENAPSMVVWGIADNRSWLENSEQTKPLLFDPTFAAKKSYLKVVDTFEKYAIAAGVDSEIEEDMEPASKYVDVYNLMGQKVASQMLREDVETLPAGLYIIDGKKIYVK